MEMLRKIAKNIPGIPFLYRALVKKSNSPHKVFREIYRSNAWCGKDSVSGTGSDAHQTRIIASELPTLFNDLNITTMLDIPCGDFHWMKSVNLNSIDYIGADIVKELIKNNKKKYTRDGVRFQHLNLMKDKLPRVDLVFCRDCLVHLSFADINLALDSIYNSQSKYFLTTIFTDRTTNHDIATGEWHTLNLELEPFMLPKPLKIIYEGCTENDGIFKDKALGLWKVADIRV